MYSFLITHVLKGCVMQSYKELQVWQKSIELITELYKLTRRFPDSEKFGLVSQINRSGVSIASNIAEGWGRGSRNEYIHHLYIARGSVYELETQLLISSNLKIIDDTEYRSIQKKVESIAMMLNKLISRLKS